MSTPFRTLKDPAKLPDCLPADLLGVRLRMEVVNVDGQVMFEHEFTAENPDELRMMWPIMYRDFGTVPFAMIVLTLWVDTPLKDAKTGQPFTRVSFLHVHDKVVSRFDAKEASDIMSGIHDFKGALPAATAI